MLVMNEKIQMAELKPIGSISYDKLGIDVSYISTWSDTLNYLCSDNARA